MKGTALLFVVLVAGGWYAITLAEEESVSSETAQAIESRRNSSQAVDGEKRDWEALRSEVPSNPKQALEYANGLRSREPNVWTSLTTEAIEFRYPDGVQVNIPLGDDEVAISIAPYRMNTHPCTVHSVTGCRGELTRREFSVTVTDPTGTVILSESVSTGDNGFFELWLPRDQNLVLAVSSPLGTARREVSTSMDAATCITDLQLI